MACEERPEENYEQTMGISGGNTVGRANSRCKDSGGRMLACLRGSEANTGRRVEEENGWTERTGLRL